MIKKNENIIIIGIGGCSRCGKTKLTKELIQQYINLTQSNLNFCNVCSSIHLDRYNINKKYIQIKYQTLNRFLFF